MKKLLIIALALLSVSIVRADEGMWLLSKLKPLNIEKMQQMGFKLTAEDIYDVNKPGIKDAIVGLGNAGRPFRHFCSGEIISPNGLMLTNHHCGFSAIQSHSSVEHDYLADGFWAYKMEDELTNPGVTASILERMEAAWTWRPCARPPGRTPPGSCSPTPTPWACSIPIFWRSPGSSTTRGACATTTEPTSTPSWGWPGPATWALIWST